MKPAKLLFAAAVLFVSSSLLAAPPAAAQTLDGAWYKLKARVKGYSVDPATGDMAIYKSKQWVFLSLAYKEGGPTPGTPVTYYATTYTETAPGVWAITDQGEITSSSATEQAFPSVEFVLPGMGGSSVSIHQTPLVMIKTDSYGALLRTGWKNKGEVFSGDDGTGRWIYGDIDLTGRGIDISRCPFIP